MDIDIIERKPLSMHALHEKMDVLKAKVEFNFRAQRVDEYLKDFLSGNKKDPKVLREKLEQCCGDKLKDRHIAKLIDTMPRNADEIKSLFVGEHIILKAEELKQIEDALAH